MDSMELCHMRDEILSGLYDAMSALNGANIGH